MPDSRLSQRPYGHRCAYLLGYQEDAKQLWFQLNFPATAIASLYGKVRAQIRAMARCDVASHATPAAHD